MRRTSGDSRGSGSPPKTSGRVLVFCLGGWDCDCDIVVVIVVALGL